jgi:hypothetical protein
VLRFYLRQSQFLRKSIHFAFIGRSMGPKTDLHLAEKLNYKCVRCVLSRKGQLLYVTSAFVLMAIH